MLDVTICDAVDGFGDEFEVIELCFELGMVREGLVPRSVVDEFLPLYTHEGDGLSAAVPQLLPKGLLEHILVQDGLEELLWLALSYILDLYSVEQLEDPLVLEHPVQKEEVDFVVVDLANVDDARHEDVGLLLQVHFVEVHNFKHDPLVTWIA